MALPKQLKKQVEDANKIMEDMQKVPEQPTEEPLQEPEAQSPEQAQEVPEAKAVPEESQEERKEVDWEQKYKVLKGKYDKEVPRLSGEVRDLKRDMEQLRGYIAEQSQRPKEQGTQATQAEAFVTEEEIEDYGPEFMDVVGRKAKEIATQMTADLRRELADVKKQVGAVGTHVAASDRDKMFAKLDTEVENWQALNNQEEFLSWLDQHDPYSGEVRGKLLRNALESNDASRAIAFYKGFLKEHATVSTGSAEPQFRDTQKADLEELVAPGKPKGHTPSRGAQDEKRIWTEAEVEQFYADRQAGAFKGKKDEAEKIERQIFAAIREGRVQPGQRVPFQNAAY